ncbi:tryptophan synthase beta chain [Striga asiatica]|uniref:Tryptophan synthase beta chain n=1 Tax=Striga asiatica TaxID=4170 RepID=A0A5A7NXJ8_STRAF|nr:tryptophan synthase beta chain [Striga asiatica]
MVKASTKFGDVIEAKNGAVTHLHLPGKSVINSHYRHGSDPEARHDCRHQISEPLRFLPRHLLRHGGRGGGGGFNRSSTFLLRMDRFLSLQHEAHRQIRSPTAAFAPRHPPIFPEEARVPQIRRLDYRNGPWDERRAAPETGRGAGGERNSGRHRSCFVTPSLVTRLTSHPVESDSSRSSVLFANP